jgi:glucose-6-phosphate 1-epimerase
LNPLAQAKLTEYNGHPAVALRASDGARATILLHGGHLVSWIPAGGDEQLYVSPTSQYGEGQAVRGGVPVIFPQFSNRGTLPRHGLLRTRGWELGETVSHGGHAQAVLRFTANDDTRALWPHYFEAEDMDVHDDSSCSVRRGHARFAPGLQHFGRRRSYRLGTGIFSVRRR